MHYLYGNSDRCQACVRISEGPLWEVTLYFLHCVRLYRWASQLDQEVGFLAGSKYSGDCSYCTNNFGDGRHAKLGEEKPLLLLRGQLLIGEDTYVVSSSRFVGTSKGRKL